MPGEGDTSSKGFAMKLGAGAKKPKVAAAASAIGAADAPDAGPVREQIGEVVDGHVGEKKAAPTITPLANTLLVGGGGRKLGEEAPPAIAEPAAAAPAAAAPAPAAPAAPVDEDAAAAKLIMQELQDGGTSSIFALDDTARYRQDVAARADDAAASDDVYERMPIEEFGAAVLRGYGWEEGKGVGSKEAVVPVEYVPRPTLLGLGATPKAAEASTKQFIKPGESRAPKEQMVYVDEQGRQRHVKKVDEKLVKRGPSGFAAGALVALTAGPHKGLYARVVSTGGLDHEPRALLRLAKSGVEVSVKLSECEPVKDARLERERPGFTHQEAEKRREAAAGGSGGGSKRAAGDGDGDGERSHKKHKKHHKESRDRDRGRDGGGGERSGPSSSSAAASSSARGPPWVREQIRVRIVDRDLERGALYSKKGTVVDASGAGVVSVRLDDPPRIVEGVPTAALETALPKKGGAVCVVLGPHRNRRGTLLERVSADDRAVVQLGGDFQIVECTFEQVAEWTGPAGDGLDDDLVG